MSFFKELLKHINDSENIKDRKLEDFKLECKNDDNTYLEAKLRWEVLSEEVKQYGESYKPTGLFGNGQIDPHCPNCNKRLLDREVIAEKYEDDYMVILRCDCGYEYPVIAPKRFYHERYIY